MEDRKVYFFTDFQVEKSKTVSVQAADLPPPKNNSPEGEREMPSWSEPVRVCSAAFRVGGGRGRRVGSAHRLTHPDSQRAEGSVSPEAAPPCQTAASRVRKKPTASHPLKHAFVFFPGARKPNPDVSHSTPTRIQEEHQSAVMFGRICCVLFLFAAHKQNSEV